jgi:hypothetical protein
MSPALRVLAVVPRLRLILSLAVEHCYRLQVLRSRLKNTDNKTICGVYNCSMRLALARNICSDQNGFVHGRQFINNIVERDTQARVRACEAFGAAPLDPNARSGTFPLTPLFDFAVAFPSISQTRVAQCMAAAGFPRGFADLTAGVYHLPSCLSTGQTNSSFLWWAFSGILQGCPLSGTLFAVGTHPLLCELKHEIEGKQLGVTRACADYIGAALRDISALRPIKCVFDTAAACANLQLQPTKCVLVPGAVACSAEVVAAVGAWLCRWIPDWKHFSVASHALYLGAMVGPAAGAHQWTAAMSKWKGRVAKFVSAGAAIISTTAYIYNSRGLPVLAYLAQLFPMPANFQRAEALALQKMMHLPGNSTDAQWGLHLRKFGALSFKSGKVQGPAAMMRAALQSLTTW